MHDLSVTWCAPCSVSARFSGENDDQSEIWSGCAFETGNKHLVVTHFLPFLKFMKCQQAKSLQYQEFAGLENSSQDVKTKISIGTGDRNIVAFPAFALRSRRLELVLKKILVGLGSSSKKCDSNEEKPCCNAHLSQDFLSWFLIFEIELETKPENSFSQNFNGTKIHQGMPLWIETCPFGAAVPSVFEGCISKGILSNVVQNTVFIIDMYCLPGSEGGAVFTDDKNNTVIGIIVSPLTMKSGELSGLGIACSFPEILSCLAMHTSSNLYNRPLQLNPCVANAKLKSYAPLGLSEVHYGPDVVVLKHMKGWGSGVVVALDTSPDKMALYIATCAHVVSPAGKSLYAQVGLGRHLKWHQAEIVFVADKSWFDFSLVKVKLDKHNMSSVLHRMQMATYKVDMNPLCFFTKYIRYPRKGMDALSKGHCLFENCDMLPTITKGVISSVGTTKIGNSQPVVLIHSTCVVHDGASGGALLSSDSHQLLGLLVNNVKETQSEDKVILYPKVNFTLPAPLFMPAVERFVLGQSDALQFLNRFSSIKADVWCLGNELDDNQIQAKL